MWLVVFSLLFGVALFSQSHTLVSLPSAPNNITYMKMPNGTLLDLSDVKGSLILSWDQGVSGMAGGFCDLTLYTGFDGGGKYEISLLSVTSSSDNMISGFWGIVRNGGIMEVTNGKATNLKAVSGDEITIAIDNIVIKVKITAAFNGLFDPLEVTGQLFVDDYAFVGAKVKLKDDDIETQETDMEGKFLFLLSDFSEFIKVVLVFKNYDPEIVISGYAYVGGKPLVGAKVTVQNQEGVLTTTTTNAEGFYKTAPIIGAVGAAKNNVRTIIKP